MSNTMDNSVQNGFSDEMHSTYSLGFKEFIFLTFIFFFGFCGFTICVDKLYSGEPAEDKIDSVIRHDDSLSAIDASSTKEYAANNKVR